MEISAGLWIDHSRAAVLLMNSNDEALHHFSCGDQQGAGKEGHAYTRSDRAAEDKLERKDDALRNHFYDEIIKFVDPAKEVFVFGPGEAKGEFKKRLEGLKSGGHTVHASPADKMTDNEIVKHARELLKAQS